MASTADAAQLHASDLVVERGGHRLLDGISLTVGPGDRIGLVGPNGAGKTTLLLVLAGQLASVSGTVATVPSDATVGLMPQEIDVGPDETIGDHLARRTGVAAASAALDTAAEALSGAAPDAAAEALSGAGSDTGAAIEQHQWALDRWLRLGGADLQARIGSALADAGLEGDGISSRSPARLSGGQQSRLGLAALHLARHDILLLDEPTNNLDGDGLDRLEAFVLGASAPLIVVSHDRRFLERTVTSVVELDDRGNVARFNGGWAAFLEAREVAAAEAARRYDDYDRERSRLKDRARLQRSWAEKGVRAERQPRDNDRLGRSFRLERTEKQAAKARMTERAIERLAPVDKPWQRWELRFTIAEAGRSGDLVASLTEAEVALGTFRFGPVTTTIRAGDRVAVLGENGAGKTTLVRALLGGLDLDRGHHRLGSSVVVGQLDQARDRLGLGPEPGSDSFLDRFGAETGLAPQEARTVLAKFALTADHLGRPAIEWSPGERTRAVLAAFQASGVNTLVLDEPTNHLDLPAIEQLEGALDRFGGTVILITHDRAFLDAVRLTRVVTVADGRLVADRTPVSDR